MPPFQSLQSSCSHSPFRCSQFGRHEDPITKTLHGRCKPLADITDVFAFPDPNDASKVALVMDVRPLIPAGMYGKKALDPNVLYQFKIAGAASRTRTTPKRRSSSSRRSSTGTNQKITLYGTSAPNEVGTTKTLVKKTGTFDFGKVSTLDGGNIKVFVGPRRDPFFFDLAQFFKIVPDRNFMNHPSPPPPTATSFRFASKNEPIVLNGVSYGTAGSNGCIIANPHDISRPTTFCRSSSRCRRRCSSPLPDRLA